MTTLENRPNTALLVIDVQNGVVGGPRPRRRGRQHRDARRKARAREGARRVGPALRRRAGQGARRGSTSPSCSRATPSRSSQKQYGDSFEDTDLETVLAGVGVGRLVVAGAQTDECIRATLHGAFVRGYDATLVERRAHDRGPDRVGRAAAGRGHRAHQSVLEVPRAPGRTAGTVTTKEVVLQCPMMSTVANARAGAPGRVVAIDADAARW